MAKHSCVNERRLENMELAIKEFYQKAESMTVSQAEIKVEMKKEFEGLHKKLDNGISSGVMHILEILKGNGHDAMGMCAAFAQLQKEHQERMADHKVQKLVFREEIIRWLAKVAIFVFTLGIGAAILKVTGVI